jgi:hypothetical protein
MKSNINQESSPCGIATIPSSSGSTPLQQTCEEHGAKQDYLSASRKGPRMKAVLEFEYPQDEHKLEHALKGGEYYDALCRIEGVLKAPYTKADAYGKIKKIIADVLEDV